MRVAVVGPTYPFRGGIADTNNALIGAFQKEGHVVKAFTFTVQYPKLLFPGKTQLSDAQAPKDLDYVRCIHSLNPLTWMKTAKQINAFAPDLVVFRHWLPVMAMSFAGIAKRLKERNIVCICDNAMPHEKRFGDKKLTLRFFKQCKRFATLSNKVANELSQITNNPIQRLFHPINPLPPTVSRAEALAKLQLDAAYNYILFFGLVRGYKGLKLLVEAMAQVKDESIRLLIAGEFYEPRTDYDTLIAQHGLQSKVIIHEGFVAEEKLPLYFSASSLVAQTYLSASQSGITPMAVHYRVPSLVTNVGGLTQYVEHNKTGRVCEPTVASVASEIDQFFAFSREDMVQHLDNLAEELSWKKFVRELLAE